MLIYNRLLYPSKETYMVDGHCVTAERSEREKELDHKVEVRLVTILAKARLGDWPGVIAFAFSTLEHFQGISQEHKGVLKAHMARAFFHQGKFDNAQRCAEEAKELLKPADSWAHEKPHDYWHLADDVLREIKWERKQPYPGPLLAAWRQLMRRFHMDKVHSVP